MLRAHLCYEKECFQALFSKNVFIHNESFKDRAVKTGLKAYLGWVKQGL